MNNRKVGGYLAAMLYRHPLLASVTRVLAVLEGVEDPSSRRVRWTPLLAGVVAVVMAFDAGCAATTRLTDALGCLGVVLRGKRKVPQTYNGLLKALCRQFKACFPILKDDLRRQVLGVLEKAERIGGWIILAVDGSKEDLARSRSNIRAFGIGDNGAFPQAFITSIVSVATGLLWDWRVGKARASEKGHLLEMIQALPRDVLLLGDGNFVGWPIWTALCAQGTDFLIRVGGNVDLLADLLDTGRVSVWKDAQTVYLWPKKWRRTGTPLELRLIRIRSRGGSVFLLTNVLDARRMSVKRAGAIYRRRWGIEVFYRTLKRTMGVSKLQSHSGKRARVELNWALVALTVAGLLAIPAILSRRLRPDRYSPACALRVLRSALLDRTLLRVKNPGNAIVRRLAHAVGDDYTRSSKKQSRHRAVSQNTPKRYRKHHRLKPPVLTRAKPNIRTLALQKLNDARS